MILEKLMDRVEKPVGKGVFRDSNTLGMVLPTLVDLSLYTTLHDHVLDEDQRDKTSTLLLDCSESKKLCDSGIAAFMSLQKLVKMMHLRLFMVNSPEDMHDRLCSILTDAYWVTFSHQDTETSRQAPEEESGLKQI
ncbi:MAG TPA: hypothetical protein VLN56_06005 [Gammaproteobacteria bacterium]|nr:hypothetical protein [Gammaproteobacteria bacterium]